MSSSAHKRRHKHEEHDEHVNHERWLVSYADMLTVLMALFIVLFAMSQIDQLKFAQFKEGFNEGTSSSNLVLSGNKGINDIDNGADPVNIKVMAGGDPMQAPNAEQIIAEAQTAQETARSASQLEAARAEVAGYREIIERIDAALEPQGHQDQVTYRITSDGLVVGLVADNVFFANASADVQPVGLQVLDAVGPILGGLPNDVVVQGHTNSLPLSSTVRYRDNWDLSTSRANSVVTRFIDVHHVPAERLTSTGYGQTRPLYPDSDDRALAGNRRVDLVVASPSSEAVKALLPQVAETIPTDGPTELSTPASETASHDTTTTTTGGH
ncbi:flagellar motor protein MotB [Paenibacillus sp. TRM 82003]|uniref:OmpA/MotB family protein n=1 Tax=Kineococcus sp. TRM81007 TaxID=2925831 RepID=UPI001F5A6691|nr:flagellar motor protein MotB [Kineococcus sp. TRM81007]MCI2240602.1 flagellar motor protein MotB [Kineococcus sp. TRM81007]MCI3925476.1 flagellar motor protein MotB [Paenibacillus sp. TRM 82003]